MYLYVLNALQHYVKSKLSKDQTSSQPNLNMFVSRRRKEAAALHPVFSVEVGAELFLHLGQK